MSNSEFDKYFDGDWDDAGDLDWSEQDWNKFLVKIDKEIEKFVKHYHSLKNHSNRLDQTAQKMGWGLLDWDQGDDVANADALLKAFESFMNMDDDESFNEPLSINKHPAFIAIQGINQSLQQVCKRCLSNPTQLQILPTFAVDFIILLEKMKMESILGVNALDLGDLTLGIAHLKRSLSELNRAFGFAGNLKDKELSQEIFDHLFDLRELWLRVIEDCKRCRFEQEDSSESPENDNDEDFPL